MSAKDVMTVFSPATVANVGCGFDILGFAVEQPGDEITVSLTNRKDVRILSIAGDDGKLPLDPSKNSAGVSVIALLQKLKVSQGVDITIVKKMPLGSGLGSSAAGAAGSVFALNKLLGEPFTTQELVPFAMEGERVCSGTAHADNVAPALMGGFVTVRSYDPPDFISIPTKIPLFCLLVKPHTEILTKNARKILQDNVPLKKLVCQTGNLAGLIIGLIREDISLIGRSLVDVIIEPQRAPLIPGYESIRNTAYDSGAIACSISGSGPSIFSLYSDNRKMEIAAEKIKEVCSREHISIDCFLTKINYSGIQIYE